MEIGDTTQDKPKRCNGDKNKLKSDVELHIGGADNCQLFDNYRELKNMTMSEVTGADGSVSIDKGTESGNEDANPCANMSIDISKEESDLSDYGEEDTTCQLANQALRAKLLSSVANSVTGNESKLRVSVFDHRIIPKRFVIPKKIESRPSVCGLDTVGIDMNKRPQNFNGFSARETENGKRKSQMSYAVLKASKKHNGDSVCLKTLPTSPDDSENDVRTRFDVLLRNLIGDVDDLHMTSTPTPVTFSSGYESDYPQNKDIENKSKSDSSNSLKRDKSSDSFKHNANKIGEFVNGYTSEALPLNRRTGSLQGSHEFSSLPSFPLQYSEPNIGSLKWSENRDIPMVKVSVKDRDTDSQGFSYAQRHNYKLTKVTRSMYEIIHDLQNGEKSGTDGRKRSRKGRRSSQEINSFQESGNTSARDSKMRGRIQSEAGIVDNKTDHPVTMRRNESAPTPFTGGAFRSVRRPLGGESHPSHTTQRNFSHSENTSRLVGSLANDNCNKVQNDLRNLLCDTSDVTMLSGENNGHQRDLNTLSGSNNTFTELSSTGDSRYNQTGLSIKNESSANEGQRRATLTEQFKKRSKPDDHVYETIPGDEKLYEEWKKMRQNPKIPKIRRFTTIPDLPGTFIPKEPPALPERKYLNPSLSQNPTRDNDNYIFMGDMNSNFPSKPNLNTSCADHGLNQISSGNVLFESSFFQCYPLADDSSPQHAGRTDETSDGYCSIDNLSLLRDSVNDASFPDTQSRDWIFSRHESNYPYRPPRDDYFLSPMSQEEMLELQNTQERFRTEIPRLLSRQKSRDDDLGISFRAHSTFEPIKEPTKPIFVATYV